MNAWPHGFDDTEASAAGMHAEHTQNSKGFLMGQCVNEAAIQRLMRLPRKNFCPDAPLWKTGVIGGCQLELPGGSLGSPPQKPWEFGVGQVQDLATGVPEQESMVKQCCQPIYALAQAFLWPQLSQKSYDFTLQEESITVPVVDTGPVQGNTDRRKGYFRHLIEDEIEGGWS
jgi:hypothetical protein